MYLIWDRLIPNNSWVDLGCIQEHNTPTSRCTKLSYPGQHGWHPLYILPTGYSRMKLITIFKSTMKSSYRLNTYIAEKVKFVYGLTCLWRYNPCNDTTHTAQGEINHQRFLPTKSMGNNNWQNTDYKHNVPIINNKPLGSILANVVNFVINVTCM